MDMTTLWLLVALAIVLLVISVFCAATDRANIITIMSMLFSGIIFWAVSNSYVSGLTKINEVTGAADIIRDSTASAIFMAVGLLAIAGFVLQVWEAVMTSGIIKEMGD